MSAADERPTGAPDGEAQTWFFTFGFNHPQTGRYIVIRNADVNEARDKMFAAFGREWGFQYDWDDWHKGGVSQAEKYGLTEMPLPPAPSGEGEPDMTFEQPTAAPDGGAMRVLVCGSRSWSDWASVGDYIAALPAGSVVVHGGAAGADTIADHYARGHGLDVEVYLADWQLHGRRAGVVRNLAMLDTNPDRVAAFWDGRSRGTKHTIDEARLRGIPVDLVNDLPRGEAAPIPAVSHTDEQRGAAMVERLRIVIRDADGGNIKVGSRLLLEAVVALDGLLAELDQARQERDEALGVREGHVSAVQKVIQLQAELDQAKRALARIADSYGWIEYVADECVEGLPIELARPDRPLPVRTNRRTAREALAALSPEQTEPGADAQAGGETP